MATQTTASDIRKKAVDTIRTLAMDAVQAANSGHPGTAMAMAPVLYSLWQNHLAFDPQDPIWPNRDRFVLSVGHASMLDYAMLYLSQVKAVNGKYETLGEPSVKLEDIKAFRQLGSRCPGHPEYRWTSGVETTTGPLGQGVANSVGMAMASRWLARRFNRPGFDLFNFRVYALAGDGCMMEGISSEAASLAGHLRLGNLCWIYDNNHITIEGHTQWAFSEDVRARFESYGWRVVRLEDANRLEDLDRAFKEFKEQPGLDQPPTLLVVDSHIAFGSPNKQDTSAAHGAPLGAEEIRATKQAYGWPDKAFHVPEGVLEHFEQGIGARGGSLSREWKERFEAYRKEHPALAAEIEAIQKREMPKGWDTDAPQFEADPKGLATRKSSSMVLNHFGQKLPWLVGGSADLAPSTLTRLEFEGAGDFLAGAPEGRNLHFGVREHAMGAILNGLSLCKLRPFGSTFLIFSDYLKPAVRLSALMELPVIYIFTHDSIGVGEDGPTHQPVEQLAGLRAIPGLITLRPADANEVVEAWKCLLAVRHRPAALILTRQNVPTLDREKFASASGTAKGAYVLVDSDKAEPEVILIGTGSEVHLCVRAWEALTAKGVAARVVSMPSWELFETQDQAYREQVLPPSVKARVAVEQASSLGWHRYVGSEGKVIAMETFGASAPLAALQDKFGFSPEKVVQGALELLGK